MADPQIARAHVQLVEGHRFTATFPDVPTAAAITLDESRPLGAGAGPTPAGVLAAAIGGCVSASLTLCLAKAHLEPDAVNAHVTARIARNESGRLRIERIDVELTPCFAGADQSRLDRCKALFEDFCIVTESVREGIPVNVEFAEQRLPAFVPPDLRVEWKAVSQGRRNFLLAGMPSAVDGMLDSMLPYFSEPIRLFDPDTERPLSLPAEGTLILTEIGKLTANQQLHLQEWLDQLDHRGHVQIVSTTSRPMVGLMESGEFRAELYYRLNVVRMDVELGTHLSA